MKQKVSKIIGIIIGILVIVRVVLRLDIVEDFIEYREEGITYVSGHDDYTFDSYRSKEEMVFTMDCNNDLSQIYRIPDSNVELEVVSCDIDDAVITIRFSFQYNSSFFSGKWIAYNWLENGIPNGPAGPRRTYVVIEGNHQARYDSIYRGVIDFDSIDYTLVFHTSDFENLPTTDWEIHLNDLLVTTYKRN